MGWARFDDGYSDNPKILEAGPMAELLDCRAIIYAARMETDGLITKSTLTRISHGITKLPTRVQALVDVGRWEQRDGGYWIHDFLKYNPSRSQKESERIGNRTRQEVYRTRGLADAIKQRDGDLCRYCGRDVNWKDRRGPAGAVFEHVYPVTKGGETTLENLVVACRECNAKKSGRTPKEANMTLLESRTYLGPEPRYVGSGRESLSLETKEDVETTAPTWVRMGMSRTEWMAAGRPEAETA